MSRPFSNVALFGKPRAENIREPLLAIARIVESAGAKVLFDAATRELVQLDEYPGHSVHAIGKQADVAIVLGGDGTMLGIARELAPHQVPLIGINHGRLGFMTDVSLDQMAEALVPMLRGAYETDRRVLLDGEVRRGGKATFHAAALNDIVVSRGVTGGMVEYTVRVDGAVMYNQRADAVIVATPTGSTAYALSADGPILYPSLAGLLLVPVAPQTLSNRPIVLNDDVVIEIEITDERDAMAHFDMQSYEQLAPGDIVRVKRSAHVATLLHPVGYNFFATLRQKLHWSVMPSEPHSRG
ncbi:MAG: NAD kinase [Pseudomonadota bacterium]|nr:NAD kinase [Burkholderiaceae bacterium]MDQ3445827.1 NAD kinase [Pseudomonadota bacterium]